MTQKYDPDASKEVEKTMREHKREGRFRNRQQAVAVGPGKTRRTGERVPEKKEGA